MKTGRGELIHKTYKEEVSNKSSKVATDKILMQVAGKAKRMNVTIWHV
jgi:hypothetical protein